MTGLSAAVLQLRYSMQSLVQSYSTAITCMTLPVISTHPHGREHYTRQAHLSFACRSMPICTRLSPLRDIARLDHSTVVEGKGLTMHGTYHAKCNRGCQRQLVIGFMTHTISMLHPHNSGWQTGLAGPRSKKCETMPGRPPPAEINRCYAQAAMGLRTSCCSHKAAQLRSYCRFYCKCRWAAEREGGGKEWGQDRGC